MGPSDDIARADEIDAAVLDQLSKVLSEPQIQKGLAKVGRRFVSASKIGRYPDTKIVLRIADPESGREWDDPWPIWHLDVFRPDEVKPEYIVKQVWRLIMEPGGNYG